MPEFIFYTRDLKKKYDDKEVLKGVTLAFYYGAKIGVIGHNGSGKSTLLRVMAGVEREFEGEARLQEGRTVGYVSQEPPLDPTKTVLGNVEEAVKPIRDLLKRYDDVNHRLGEDMSPEEMEKLLDQQQRLQDEIDAKNAWELDHQLELAMHALGCPPADADVTKISGGERRRVALCKTLLAQPDLLLLDEPTNHLDASTTAWLENHLKEYKGTVILVTHDRYFLDNVVSWMLEMDRGRATPFEGNYSTYLDKKRRLLEVEAKSELARQKTLARELEWIRQSPRARVAKNKARIANYERLVAEQDDKVDGTVELQLPPAPHLGERVVIFDKVTKSVGGRTLMKDLSLRLPPGSILGVIGPNGAGKTTFLKMITGEVKPDSGKVEIGPTVQLCYVDQLRAALDPELTVFQQITGGQEQLLFGKKWVNGRAYVSRFNFRGADQQTRIGELSGGQRNRVQLATLLRKGGNLILLDEPTNDLDLETLRVLEDAIQGFTGSLIIVTHDRYFLNRVATHVLAFEGDGAVRFFEGDFSTYEERVAQEREAAGKGGGGADKYRKFTR
ncbi:MAG TPA: energy-dependent translational throttle protein EttA [Planctomycetota bacterium]|nr:energy-dependent translational throttle protein EttA [Planctomycetota bacterium]